MNMTDAVPEIAAQLRPDPFDVRRTRPGKYTLGVTFAPEGIWIAVIQRKGKEGRDHFLLAHLERLAADREGRDVVHRIAALANPLADAREGTVIVDQTRIGYRLHRALCDVLRDTGTVWFWVTTTDDATNKAHKLGAPLSIALGELVAAVERVSEARVWRDVKGLAPRLEVEARNRELSPSSHAVALALWQATSRDMRGEYAGRKPQPRQGDEARSLEIAANREQAMREVRERQEKNAAQFDPIRGPGDWEPYQ